MTPSRRLYAFSLIELLVVIGLIAILGSLLLMGINHLIINSKRQQTRLTFQNLQSMYSEWDAVNHRHIPSYQQYPQKPQPWPPPPPFPPSGVATVTMPCPENVTLGANPNPQATPDDTTPSNRYGQAVWETRDFIAMFTTVPTNATALGKMPPSSLMTFPASLVNYTVVIPNLYNNTPPIQPFNPNSSYYPVWYASNPNSVNSFATIPIPNPLNSNQQIQLVFRCIRPDPDPTVPGSAIVAPPDPGYWMSVAAPVDTSNGWQSSALTVPVPLDAWGNPIIFVPGGQLGTPVSTAPSPLAGSGVLIAGGNPTVVSSPDGRPFWASAGPDGDFSLGDDNLYSFER